MMLCYQLLGLLSFLTTIVSATTPYTFPSFIISHKLISGLRESLPHSQQLPFTISETNDVINRVLEECSSDAYLIVNLPGLVLEDFEKFKSFVHLRKYMAQSSTIVTFPNTIIDEQDIDENASSLLDVDSFERTLKIHCNTLTMKVEHDDDEEIPQYIDIRKRLIKVNLSPLPGIGDVEREGEIEEEEEGKKERERDLMLSKHDELIYKIVRKLPSPHVTILFTTSTLAEYNTYNDGDDEDTYIVTVDKLPDDPRELDEELRDIVWKSKTSIFPDISIFDKTRYLDFERNEKGERNDYQEWTKDAQGEPKDETWVERKKKVIEIDEKLTRFGELDKYAPSILSKDLLMDNALLIAGGAFLIIALLSADILRFIFFKLKVLMGKNNKQKSQ